MRHIHAQTLTDTHGHTNVYATQTRTDTDTYTLSPGAVGFASEGCHNESAAVDEADESFETDHAALHHA